MNNSGDQVVSAGAADTLSIIDMSSRLHEIRDLPRTRTARRGDTVMPVSVQNEQNSVAFRTHSTFSYCAFSSRTTA